MQSPKLLRRVTQVFILGPKLRIAVIQIFIFFSLFSGLTYAAQDPCAEALENQVLALAKLIVKEKAGEKVDGIQQKRQALQASSKMTAEDLDEALQHQVAMLEAQSMLEAEPKKDAVSVSAGTGSISEEDRKKVEKALEFARSRGLKIQAAFMEACKEGNLDVIAGFMLMAQKKSAICSDLPGYGRFCKDLDLDAGFNGEDFLVEAAKVSAEAAMLLINAGIKVNLEKLAQTQSGSTTTLPAIARGARASFAKLIPMPDETAALALLQLGQDFTIEDLMLAITHNRQLIFEVALNRNQSLASAYAKDGSFPLPQS